MWRAAPQPHSNPGILSHLNSLAQLLKPDRILLPIFHTLCSKSNPAGLSVFITLWISSGTDCIHVCNFSFEFRDCRFGKDLIAECCYLSLDKPTLTMSISVIFLYSQRVISIVCIFTFHLAFILI